MKKDNEELSDEEIYEEFLKFLDWGNYTMYFIKVNFKENPDITIDKLIREGYEVFPHVMVSHDECNIHYRKLKEI